MMSVPITLVSISPAQWHELLDVLAQDLTLLKSMEHPSLRASVKVVRAANFNLQDLKTCTLPAFQISPRLAWHTDT